MFHMYNLYFFKRNKNVNYYNNKILKNLLLIKYLYIKIIKIEIYIPQENWKS